MVCEHVFILSSYLIDSLNIEFQLAFLTISTFVTPSTQYGVWHMAALQNPAGMTGWRTQHSNPGLQTPKLDLPTWFAASADSQMVEEFPVASSPGHGLSADIYIKKNPRNCVQLRRVQQPSSRHSYEQAFQEYGETGQGGLTHVDAGAGVPGLAPQVYPSLAARPRARVLAFLCLNFFIYKVGKSSQPRGVVVKIK